MIFPFCLASRYCHSGYDPWNAISFPKQRSDFFCFFFFFFLTFTCCRIRSLRRTPLGLSDLIPRLRIHPTPLWFFSSTLPKGGPLFCPELSRLDQLVRIGPLAFSCARCTPPPFVPRTNYASLLPPLPTTMSTSVDCLVGRIGGPLRLI